MNCPVREVYGSKIVCIMEASINHPWPMRRLKFSGLLHQLIKIGQEAGGSEGG